jgi:probable O-glycosylation ligase (exosortase A-associated)
MKQTIFMVVVTGWGVVGPLFDPTIGVAVYYLFAVLRPQFLWQWALPEGVSWSLFVAMATIAGTFMHTVLRMGTAGPPKRLTLAHVFFAAFAIWISVTYVTAIDPAKAYPWWIEYLKIFAMFAVSTIALKSINSLRVLMMMTALALGYIAYEINFLYLVDGYLGVYHNGWGGLDNNGAGVMLAMGATLCLAVWDMERRWWRWFFASLIPPIVHAVLMTYSRGAMVALALAAPLIIVRSRRPKQLTLGALIMGAMLPILAGQEIRDRFFSVEKYEEDRSAQSRFGSWAAAWRIAKDHPVFGVGIRNSQLISYQYGADERGRTIHSQYLQLLADGGFPALTLYLGLLFSTWMSVRRIRREARSGTRDEDRYALGVALGVETSMAVFCIGTLFLSLEVFELPWLMLLLGSQVRALYQSEAEELDMMKTDDTSEVWSVGPLPTARAS